MKKSDKNALLCSLATVIQKFAVTGEAWKCVTKNLQALEGRMSSHDEASTLFCVPDEQI